MSPEASAEGLWQLLASRADPDFAATVQRYFPTPIDALGVSNATVARLAYDYTEAHPELSAHDRLAIADRVIGQAGHHEEVLLGFALLHRVAKRELGPELLEHSRRWLESAVTNWAQCDDLCLKLLYPYFLGHLDDIPLTRAWVSSPGSWARRAANVAVVKFVVRKVGKQVYRLPLEHVLDNCRALMLDEDVYVQKGCGWLLKVTAPVHPLEVEEFLRTWHHQMKRDTFRYALEKVDPTTRAQLMSLTGGASR